MRGMREVPAARNLLRLSHMIGGKSARFTKTVNDKTKASVDSLTAKYDETKKEITVHPSILIGLMTLAVAFEAARGVIVNMVEGFVEAVMKVSSAFSDSLQEYYRNKFSAKNDLQEISIALVLVFASIYSAIVNFFSTVGGTIKTGLIQLILQLFGKDLSTCVSHVWTVVFIFIQLHFLFAFMTPKIFFFGLLILVVLSFFFKMDDLPEEEEKKIEAELEAEEKKKEDPESAVPASSEEGENEATPSTEAPARLSREDVEKIVNDLVNKVTPLPEELDFHGWTVADVDKVMPLYFEARPEKDITFIPGRGLHAESGKPTIKPHICDMFKEDGLDFYLHHQGGRVTVNFTKGKQVERTFPEADEDKINNA